MISNTSTQTSLTYSLTDSQKKLSIIGIGTSAFMISAEFYIVGAIIPVLMQYFHATFMTVQWIIIIYTFILTVMVLGAARLGDMYDKKRLFLLGLGLFTISSFLCGLAPNIITLIAFRGLQGLGAVLIWALRNAIITEIFPVEERGQAIGWVTGLSSLGLAMGPGFGGLLIGIWDWRLLFWINLPIGLIASIVIARYVPNCIAWESDKKLDLVGLLLMTLTLGCFVLGITRIQSLSSVSLLECVLFGLSAIGLLCFLYFESRVEEPILDMGLLRLSQLNVHLLLFIAIYIIVGLIQLVFPLFLELGLHYSAEKVSFLMTFLPLTSVIVAPASGSLSDRLGGRTVVLTGLALIEIGCVASSTLHGDATALGFCIRGILIELGLIVSVIPISKIVMDSVKQEQLGVASGLLALSRMLGIVTGTCLFGLLFSIFTFVRNNLLPNLDEVRLSVKPFDIASLPTSALVQGTDTIFIVMALIALVAILFSTFIT